MQKLAPSYLSGGYLRDQIIGVDSNDIDILTEIPITEVQKLFPKFQSTEKGLEFGVGRFVYNNLHFEVMSYGGQSIEEAILHKDFVMNSMYHDGESLFDPFNAQYDIKNKVIKSLEDPYTHFETNPQAYLRAIRFSGQLGFNLDDKLKGFLIKNTSIFFANNESRIQQEGYKIIQSPYPLNALQLLSELGIFNSFQELSLPNEMLTQQFPYIADKAYIRFLLVSEYTGLEFSYNFIDNFRLAKQLKEKIHRLSPFLYSDTIPTDPKLLNTVILLKRNQYIQNEPAFIAFLNNVRNQKNGQ